MEVTQVRIATVFMLDLNIPTFIRELAGKGYITARVKQTLQGVNVISIEPPNVIAMKGTVRIDYDFGRKALGVEGSTPREVVNAFNDVQALLKEAGVDVERALIPYEAVITAEGAIKPKFTDNSYDFRNLLGFNLRLAGAHLAMDGGDPTSNKWFDLEISPIWIAYGAGERGSMYRITMIYRDEKIKILNLIENVENILRGLIGGV